MERLTNSDKEIPTLDDNAEYWLKVYFKLKDYEDLEEQGRLLKLPCAIGDTVWNIETGKLEPFFANGFNIRQLQKFVDGINYELLNFKQFGKTVFLTKSEAEAKLKELRGETK